VIVERKEGRVRGTLSYLRIDPPNGSIEIGMVLFSEGLQRTTAATEAVYLLLRHAFELGYRRVEWKCDSLNAPSRRAAERLGFSFEGVFRQAMVVKGRNRDTAWYSMLDREWPLLQPAFDAWLAPANFDTNGRQRERLSPIIGEICRRIHSQIGSA
jgi:RimJ/RimL family protein N-acetyltransferase